MSERTIEIRHVPSENKLMSPMGRVQMARTDEEYEKAIDELVAFAWQKYNEIKLHYSHFESHLDEFVITENGKPASLKIVSDFFNNLYK
jgi:hypothetical protein